MKFLMLLQIVFFHPYYNNMQIRLYFRFEHCCQKFINCGTLQTICQFQ